MLVTFFKTGESPRKFGYDGVLDLEVDRKGVVTISGLDKFDHSAYMIFFCRTCKVFLFYITQGG